MPKLLRRNEGNGAAAAAPPAEPEQAPPPPEPAMEAPPPQETSAAPLRGSALRDDYEMPGPRPLPAGGALGSNPPIPYEPAPPPPESARSSGSLFQRALGDPGAQSAAERDRIAAMEFEQAIAPVMDLMRSAVPGASTPEEAARILSENQPEMPQDPNPGAYVPGDAFDRDARVYYRLLRRNYERNPRPSEQKKTSHHLHGVYGKLPGTRGW